MVDFAGSKLSASLPDCSYLPGIHSASLKEVLPSFIYKSLQLAFIEFGKKMKGYFTNDAVVVATESRTSSPVRIPRDNETLQHPQITSHLTPEFLHFTPLQIPFIEILLLICSNVYFCETIFHHAYTGTSSPEKIFCYTKSS
jgi:hypothetical protein